MEILMIVYTESETWVHLVKQKVFVENVTLQKEINSSTSH